MSPSRHTLHAQPEDDPRTRGATGADAAAIPMYTAQQNSHSYTQKRGILPAHLRKRVSGAVLGYLGLLVAAATILRGLGLA